MSEFSHGIEQTARRPNFRPKYVYTDTWPKLDSFFKDIYGTGIIGRLGLFHAIQRVTKCLRKEHKNFNTVLRKLLTCFYNLDNNDESKVIAALLDGTLNGQKHSLEEIVELQKSKKWMHRYHCFIRKVSLPVAISRIRLQEFWDDCKVTGSEGRLPGNGELDNGKSVFLPDARAAVQLMKENVEHIPVMIEDAYREIRPTGGRSKHNLVRYVAEKGESSLEQFHHLLAHFGNMGTRRTITDSLCLRGTARHNLKMWTKLLSEDEIDHSIPSHFSRHPCFLNHLNLAAINTRATRLGSNRNRQNNLRSCKKNNGEVFLSEYLLDQRKRRALYPASMPKITNPCPCTVCDKNPIPLPHEIAKAVCASIEPLHEQISHMNDGHVSMVGCQVSMVRGPGIRDLAGLTRDNRDRKSRKCPPCPLISHGPVAAFHQETSFKIPTPESTWFPPQCQPPCNFQSNSSLFSSLLWEQVHPPVPSVSSDATPVSGSSPILYTDISQKKKRKLVTKDSCCNGRREYLLNHRSGRVPHTWECATYLKP